MGPGLRIAAALLAQRGHLFAWLPVMMALGIGLYFSLLQEPSLWIVGAVGVTGLIALALGLRLPPGVSPILFALAMVALGFAWASWRAQSQAAPVLQWRYYGPVEGRIVGMDRSASDAVRLTLDQVVLRGIPPDETPARVRVSLHGEQGFTTLVPGKTVILTAHLSPPRGAVEPGGFDFRRHAWFLRLGGIGYTRTPVLALSQDLDGAGLLQVRLGLATRVRSGLPGEAGGMAAALLTGDRSGVSQDTLEDLRRTNLAHLLAISGLHMGLLAGFVFFALRLSMAAVPWIALRWPVKRLAAGAALVAAAGYLALSGGNIATERAFIMVAVALVAVLLDRRALSLRAVAVAALIVLTLRPEALLSPGFQMSFAATTALVAVFSALRDFDGWQGPRWLRPVVATVLSSAIAGLATAPVGMAHFNLLSHYGLLANVVSVPLMGLWVIPWGAVALALMPFGLEAAPLWAMGLGIDWILGVAANVADWPGARSRVMSPSPVVLPLLAVGALVVVLWQGRFRWAGLAPMVCAAVLWSQAERPDLLISEDGGLVGLWVAEGRALNRAKGASFVAEVWLENDGTLRTQAQAAALWPDDPPLRIVRGKKAARAFQGCRGGELVVSNQPLTSHGGCTIWHPPNLAGAVAGYHSEDGWRFVTEADLAGTRLWSPVPPPPRQSAQRN